MIRNARQNWRTRAAGEMAAGGMLILGISHELDCDAATVADWNEIIPYLITAAGMLLGLGAARDASR